MSRHLFKLIVTLLFLSLFAQAQTTHPLPGSLDVWMDAESRLNDKAGFRIPPRDNSALRSDFRAENTDWFSVSSYWIPESELNVAVIEEEIPAELKSELIRQRNGGREFRLFVHPESEKFYQPLVGQYPRAADAVARATASSRTVLMSFPQNPNLLFFAKLSLDVNLGNVVRTIPMGESLQSIGLTKYILKKARDLGKTFKFIPEVLGLVPKGWPRGGQIIRPIPPEIMKGETTVIPMFSLTTLDSGTTLLEKMIKASGQEPRTFVLNSILRPFVRGWTEWAIQGALTMEAHGQNVLLEINRAGQPTGSFYQRDMGGMNLDMSSPYFPKTLLSELPFASTLEADYHQNFREKARKTSMAVYFHNRVLYNIDRDLQRIEKNYRAGQILDDLWIELRQELIRQTGLSPQKITVDLLKNDINQVLVEAVKAQLTQEGHPSCEFVF